MTDDTLLVSLHFLVSTGSDEKSFRIRMVLTAIPSTSESFIDKYGKTYEKNYYFGNFSAAFSHYRDLCHMWDIHFHFDAKAASLCTEVNDSVVYRGIIPSQLDTEQVPLDNFFLKD